MADDLDHRSPDQEELFQSYVAEVEPLVARLAPEVGDDRALLGSLSRLLPSRTRSAEQMTTEDRIWLSALEHVVHRHGLSYELITCTGADDTLWLVPLH